MVRYLFYTTGGLTYQSPLVYSRIFSRLNNLNAISRVTRLTFTVAAEVRVFRMKLYLC